MLATRTAEVGVRAWVRTKSLIGDDLCQGPDPEEGKSSVIIQVRQWSGPGRMAKP